MVFAWISAHMVPLPGAKPCAAHAWLMVVSSAWPLPIIQAVMFAAPLSGYAPQATVVKECRLAIRPPICASVAVPVFGNHAGGTVRASAMCDPTCAKKSFPMPGCGAALRSVNSWVSAGFCAIVTW